VILKFQRVFWQGSQHFGIEFHECTTKQGDHQL